MASKKNRNTKPKCLNYYKRDGAKRSLEHRIYLGGANLHGCCNIGHVYALVFIC